MSIQAEKSRVAERALRAVDEWKGEAGVDTELFRAFARAAIGRVRGAFLSQHTPRSVINALLLGFKQLDGNTALGVSVSELAGRRVAVVTTMPDQPFIVDTVRLYLRKHGAEIRSGFNVVVNVQRGADGRVVGVGSEGEPWSVAVQEVEAFTLDTPDLGAATGGLTEHLALARATASDFKPMMRAVERYQDRVEGLADRHPDRQEGLRETAAFLGWLIRENFVFMGILQGETRLGIETLDTRYAWRPGREWSTAHPPGTVFVRKADVESPVHRRGRIDEVRVVVDGDEIIIRGMFTFRAVTQPSRNVPILRNVLAQQLSADDSKPGSYRYKGIANVFDSLPTEYLFTTPATSIASMIDLVLDSDQRGETGLHVHDFGDGTVFSLISMPRSVYSDDLRKDVEASLRTQLQPTYVDHGVFIGRFDTVLLHYYLTGTPKVREAAITAFRSRIKELCTPWEDRLWRVIADVHGEDRAAEIVERWSGAFPERYQLTNRAERAAVDVEHMETLLRAGRADATVADLYEQDGEVLLRVYQATNAFLTRLLPSIDHFGLTVISSDAHVVQAGDQTIHIDTFHLAVDASQREALFERRELLKASLPQVLSRHVEDDELNALVVSAGLRWDEVDVLRAYTGYLRQLQFSLPAARVRAIMLALPTACASLISLFKARFDPDLGASRDGALSDARLALSDVLRQVQTHDEAQVFTALQGLIEATLRTNAWRDDRVAHYLSFKFDCGRIREMKPERPLYEIFVWSREVEGVHLRFGKVARGGIRWSDRSDYRTEVLGLVTTQQVKNVVIVPEGSKGGFYLHEPEADPAALRKQADRLYQTFIRGLLDLTDNVVDGEQVRPPRVVVTDDFDPYLVVAADKGTAHLSDTANALSLSYGFWLGDAFASGGSNGYDHKKVGITARGAWVLVRRHFAELGRNPYAEPFTMVGVGDMGGDVFGNGLIETPHARLLAAFNHAHIFLDPDPDPAISFAERKRLFEAGRLGGWNHYDPSKISAGGGVFERRARSVPLSPAAREMLGIDAEDADPETVIRHILRMKVDLFWSGGIGTYVKASSETHTQADDRTNDRARVDATELRCAIVGEGANLSFTQAARIEAGLCGVRLNTDFIDNSAGVDLSDHEVNLKILLSGPVARGELDEAGRNTLLERLTEEVAGLVLRNNDTQGRQISRDRVRSVQDIFPFARAISFIERHFGRTRKSFQLPTAAGLEERGRAGQGLTRPELATLSSHVKRWVYAELMASGRARQLAGFEEMLLSYFPKEISERFREDVLNHQLAEQIVMTLVTTAVVADAGAAFLPLAVETTGRSVFSVCDAYLKAQRLARASEVRSTLEELRASVELEALTRAWVQVDAGCREVALFWLSSGTRPPTDAEVDEMVDAVAQVYQLQADAVARENAEIVDRMRQDDIPVRVATLVLQAQYLNIALMVWWHARKLGKGFREVVVTQLAVGRASRLQEIIDGLGRRGATGQWEPIAMRVMVNRFTDHLRQLVLRVGNHVPATSVDQMEPLLADGPVRDVRAQVDQLMPPGGPVDLPALIVLEERLAGAIGRMGA